MHGNMNLKKKNTKLVYQYYDT